VRQKPRIQLTAEGHALVDFARRLLGTAGELAAHFRTRNPLRGVLRLGVPATFAHACMTDFLLRMEQRYPELKASVRVNDSGTMLKSPVAIMRTGHCGTPASANAMPISPPWTMATTTTPRRTDLTGR